MRITAVKGLPDMAEVHVVKKWRQTLACQGRPPREVLNKAFNTYYLIKPDADGRLKVWLSDWN